MAAWTNFKILSTAATESSLLTFPSILLLQVPRRRGEYRELNTGGIMSMIAYSVPPVRFRASWSPPSAVIRCSKAEGPPRKQVASPAPSPTPTSISPPPAAPPTPVKSVTPSQAEAVQKASISNSGCKTCGKELERGCNGEGRIQGGIATVPGFGWWPIKAYRPCPGFVESGGRYQRRGQSMDEVAFGRGGKETS